MTSLYPQLPTQTPGARLSRAREDAGLTLADVAARSRVPVSALSAIDEDDYDRLPAVAYARGFLRLYAREVGLSADSILAAFDAHRAQSTAPETSDEFTPFVTGARRPRVAGRGRGNSVGLAVGAVVMAIVVALLWKPATGTDATPMGAEFSSDTVEQPLVRP